MARSIAKSVLRSRWCINGWVLEFSRCLLKAAMDRLSQRTDLSRPVQDVIRSYQATQADKSPRNNRYTDYWSFNESRSNTIAALDASYPLHIEFTTTANGSPIFFADDTDDENTITIFEFTMTFCGAGLERHETLNFGDMEGEIMFRVAEKPFSEYMNSLIYNTMGISKTDVEWFWTDLARIYRGPIGDVWYEECDRLYWRFNWRQKVAIDYFLSPEQSPFRIPAQTFRRAAVSDLRSRRHCERRGELGYYFIPRFIHFLFEVDPISLPREDPILLRWVVRACQRIRHFGDAYQRDRITHRDLGGYHEGEWDYQSIRRNQVLAKYTFDVEVRMVHYVKTGENPYPLDCPAPHLHNPITHLEATLVPGIDMAGDNEPNIVEDDYSDEEEIASLDRWHREQVRFGPNPPELSFLDHDDYRVQRVPDDDDKASDSGASESWEDNNLGIPKEVEDLEESVYWETNDLGIAALHRRDNTLKPVDDFENGSFEILVVNKPVGELEQSLDRIATELRQPCGPYWLSRNDCELPSQFVSDVRWYKKPKKK